MLSLGKRIFRTLILCNLGKRVKNVLNTFSIVDSVIMFQEWA